MLVELDDELRRIALAEMQCSVPLHAAGTRSVPLNPLDGALVLALPSQANEVRSSLPSGMPSLPLRINSAAGSLAARLPAPRTELVALASHCLRFLEIGRTMLLAAGLDREALILRDARCRDWQHGLDQARIVVCDSFTVQSLPPGVKATVFPLLADDSIVELRALEASRSAAM